RSAPCGKTRTVGACRAAGSWRDPCAVEARPRGWPFVAATNGSADYRQGWLLAAGFGRVLASAASPPPTQRNTHEFGKPRSPGSASGPAGALVAARPLEHARPAAARGGAVPRLVRRGRHHATRDTGAPPLCGGRC